MENRVGFTDLFFLFGGKPHFYGCFKLLGGLITNTVFNFILCPKSKENSMAIIYFLGTEFQFYILKGGRLLCGVHKKKLGIFPILVCCRCLPTSFLGSTFLV